MAQALVSLGRVSRWHGWEAGWQPPSSYDSNKDPQNGPTNTKKWSKIHDHFCSHVWVIVKYSEMPGYFNELRASGSAIFQISILKVPPDVWCNQLFIWFYLALSKKSICLIDLFDSFIVIRLICNWFKDAHMARHVAKVICVLFIFCKFVQQVLYLLASRGQRTSCPSKLQVLWQMRPWVPEGTCYQWEVVKLCWLDKLWQVLATSIWTVNSSFENPVPSDLVKSCYTPEN